MRVAGDHGTCMKCAAKPESPNHLGWAMLLADVGAVRTILAPAQAVVEVFVLPAANTDAAYGFLTLVSFGSERRG